MISGLEKIEELKEEAWRKEQELEISPEEQSAEQSDGRSYQEQLDDCSR